MVVLDVVDKPGQIDGAERHRDAVRGADRREPRAAAHVGAPPRLPLPLRDGAGPRRYAAVDLAPVLSVRRAVEAGTPLPAAIAARGRPPRGRGSPPPPFAALVDDAPVPVAALSGPAPLRVEYVNAALRALPTAPRPGEELASAVPAFHDDAALAAFARRPDRDRRRGRGPAPGLGRRPAPARARRPRSACPPSPTPRPLVAVVGLGGAGEARGAGGARRAAPRARRPAPPRGAPRPLARRVAALAAASSASPGRSVVDDGLDVCSARRTPSTPRSPATPAAGSSCPRSRRGLVADAALTVAAHPDLGRALRDAEPVLARRSRDARALGVPGDLHASAMPVVVAGEPLGVARSSSTRSSRTTRDNRRLLAAISAAMGFALLRDRPRRRAARAGAPVLLRRPGAGHACAGGPGDWRMMRRDLHLRDADALADLGLGEVLLEAQPQHLALARGHGAQELGERRALLGPREALLVGARPCRRASRRPRRRCRAASSSEVARYAPEASSASSTSSCVDPTAPAISATVGARRRSSESSTTSRSTLQRELLEVARDPHGPRAVAEVALDLAEDRRDRVARERHLARQVEAVDRLHEAQRRDLEEVVERLLRRW